MNLTAITIGTDDARRLGEYYTRLFGKPTSEGGDIRAWQFGSGMLVVWPHEDVHGRSTSPARVMWAVSTSDVKAEFERLKAAGAMVVREPYEDADFHGMWIATFTDPDDNYWQINTAL